jgi:pimeloyl-ACP methyl ester carboxylesterase
MSIASGPAGAPEGPQHHGERPPHHGDGAGLTWSETRVDGHRVRFAVSGSGPDALFLHGWGLRPNAYREDVRHMGLAGCRVHAPALPGFGGTPELEADQRSFAGYAAWVGRFLDSVGVGRVALVAGHSFGGGVATAFVHDQPGRAGSLLLANAIGSPTWAVLPDEVRTMMQRPAWDWGRYFGTDLLHSTRLLRVLPTLLEDFIPNLVRDPVGMFRTSAFIRRADLVAEVRTVAGRGVPVLVAWSDRDGLVPRSAFDELRRAAGVEGVVVEGSHAWLIADPEAFGQLAIHALVDSGDLMAKPHLRLV